MEREPDSSPRRRDAGSTEVRARTAIRWIVPGLAIGLLALPAAASAAATATGGASAPTPAPAPITAAPAATPISVAGDVAVAPTSLLANHVAVVSGSVGLPAAGAPVSLQLRAAKHHWVTIAAGVAAADGSFAISWRANRTGRLTLRVVSAGSALASTSSVTSTPQVTLMVFAEVVATWYGPGLYGNKTACGETLTRHIVGVADRTLPCGTPVTLRYDGRSITVPVIDRGPYTNGVTLDLTHAAAQELGMTETVTLGMLALSGELLSPTDWYPPAAPGSGSTGSTGTSVAGGATAPAQTGATGSTAATTRRR